MSPWLWLIVDRRSVWRAFAAVTNFNTHKSSTAKIVGAAGGSPVYTLSGDSMSHPLCRGTACRMIWPWVTIPNGKAPTKNPLIKAKLAVWKHDGVRQLTLGGHPLYFFFMDKKKKANGEAIVSFGGTWHVWKISSSTPSRSAAIPQGSNAGDRDADNKRCSERWGRQPLASAGAGRHKAPR